MTRRAKVWAGYSAAWVPLLLFYMYMMMHPKPILSRPAPSVPLAVMEALTYVVPVALLGVAVWWLVGKLKWPPRNIAGFVATHALGALAFSIAWLLSQVAVIASGTGLSIAIEIAKTFAGFQLIEGVYAYGLLAAGSHALRIASRLREEEALRMRAELAALRGQLNPHFLFNTLHTLTALVRRDPDTAEHALERFGDMLRYVLDVKRSQREDVTLGDELAFVRTYLSLEQLRLADRLRVSERIDPDALDCVLPSLTLQPLVENAIKYGVASRASGGTLEIAAAFNGETLELEVRDDGPGARSDVLESAKGVGLRAVRQRLETRYRGRASFGVTTAPGEGFIARVTLPAQTSGVAVAVG